MALGPYLTNNFSIVDMYENLLNKIKRYPSDPAKRIRRVSDHDRYPRYYNS